MSLRTKCLPAMMAAALLAGCSSTPEQAVRAYNDELVLAYRTGAVAGLKPYASEKEVAKIQVLVELKASQGLVLESKLLSFRVLKKAGTAEDVVLVTTEEKWSYQDRTLTPGKSPGTPFVALMTMEYTCARESGAWKVSEVRTLKNVILEPPVAGKAS